MNLIDPSDVERRFDLPLWEIGSEIIHGFHRHWLHLCRSNLLPSRADIDPANFRRILPNVILADIEHDPFRVRYRLCGTLVTEFCGNLTGQYLHEVLNPELWSTAACIHQYQTVTREARPVFSRDWLVGQFGAHHHFQTGIWPLASDGHVVDMCIAVEDYSRLRRADVDPAAVVHAF